MAQYKAKPVLVEARQWDGTQRSATNLVTWIHSGGMLAYYENVDGEVFIVINTACGPMHTSPEDWIVKGPGGFKPCNKAEFEAAYEEIS